MIDWTIKILVVITVVFLLTTFITCLFSMFYTLPLDNGGLNMLYLY